MVRFGIKEGSRMVQDKMAFYFPLPCWISLNFRNFNPKNVKYEDTKMKIYAIKTKLFIIIIIIIIEAANGAW